MEGRIWEKEEERAMPGLLETERCYVSSPETARWARSGGAVVYRSRPLSRFKALAADDGEDDAASEDGLVGPAAPHQSDDAVSNPEEERRELEERLKTLRLELASALQSAGSRRGSSAGDSGGVTLFQSSRPASRSAYAPEGADHTDSRLSSPRVHAPRHLKPIMTMEISVARIQHPKMAQAHSDALYDLPKTHIYFEKVKPFALLSDHDRMQATARNFPEYIESIIDIPDRNLISIPEELAQKMRADECLRDQLYTYNGALWRIYQDTMAQQHQDSVFTQQQHYQDRVHEFFDLEPEAMKLWSRGHSSRPHSADPRIPTPSPESQHQSLPERTHSASRRLMPVSEHNRREDISMVKELLDAIIEDAIEAAEACPAASDSVTNPDSGTHPERMQELAFTGETESEAVERAETTVAYKRQELLVAEAAETPPIPAALVQTREATRSPEQPVNSDESMDDQALHTTETIPEADVHASSPIVDEAEKCGAAIIDLTDLPDRCAECGAEINDITIDWVDSSKHNKKQPPKVQVRDSKYGTFLSTHEIKAESKKPDAHERSSPLAWLPTNRWGGEEQLAKMEQVLERASGKAGSAASSVNDPMDQPSGLGKLSGRVRTRGRILNNIRRAMPRKAGASAMAAAGEDAVGQVFKMCDGGSNTDRLMVLTSFVRRDENNLPKPDLCEGEFFRHRTLSDPVRELLNRKSLYVCEHTTVYASSSLYSTDGYIPVVYDSFRSLPTRVKPCSFSFPESYKNDLGRTRSCGLKGSVKGERGKRRVHISVLPLAPTEKLKKVHDQRGSFERGAGQDEKLEKEHATDVKTWRGDLKAKLRHAQEAELAAIKAAANASCLSYGANRHSLKMPAPATQGPLWPMEPAAPASVPRVPPLLLKQGSPVNNDDFSSTHVHLHEEERSEEMTDLKENRPTSSPASSQSCRSTFISMDEKASLSPVAALTMPRMRWQADLHQEHRQLDLNWLEASPLSLLAKEMEQEGSKRASVFARSNSARRPSPRAQWQEDVARPRTNGALSARLPRGGTSESRVQTNLPHERGVRSARAHLRTGLAITHLGKMENQWLERQEEPNSLGGATTSRTQEPPATRAWKTSAEIGRLADCPRRTRAVHQVDPSLATYSATKRNMAEHTNDKERETQQKLFEDFASQQIGPRGSKMMGESDFMASLLAANVVWDAGFGEAVAKATASGKALSHADVLQIFKACSIPVYPADLASSPQSSGPVGPSPCAPRLAAPDTRSSESQNIRTVLDVKGFLRACAEINSRLDVAVGGSYARIQGSQAARVLAIKREAAEHQGPVLLSPAPVRTAAPLACDNSVSTRPVVNPHFLLHLLEIDAARCRSSTKGK